MLDRCAGPNNAAFIWSPILLRTLHRFVEHYWHKMLCSRSRKGQVTWELVNKERFPLQRPKLHRPYAGLARTCCAVNFSGLEGRHAGNPLATFCGSRRRVTASGDPVCGCVITRGHPSKKPDHVYLAATKVGGLWPNAT
jgi:hypothetical protein